MAQSAFGHGAFGPGEFYPNLSSGTGETPGVSITGLWTEALNILVTSGPATD